MSKQDGYSSRTAVDLERKYNFGKTFAEVYDLCSEAQRAAQEASNAVDSLTPEEIFNRLTNYGDWQGIYRGDDDNIYINAEFIKGGVIKAGQVEVEAASITGELEATQINAKDLKVLAANITGTLTAGQIDVTNLQVSAANITGVLTASQISLGGSVTWDDLDSDMQTTIENAAASGGYTKKQIKTIITDELVSSPVIEGAEVYGGVFYDLEEVGELRLTYDEDAYAPCLVFEEADVGGRKNMFAILPYTVDSDEIGLALGGQVIMVGYNGTVRVAGDWDFSAARVTGL